MNSSFRDAGYEVVSTEDGSPTLQWVSNPMQEWMHHWGGAYGETQLIYGNPLREILDRGDRSAISVGLGLGYNEILVAVECLLRGIEPKDFRLLSYESEEILRNQFFHWIQKENDDQIYDVIAAFFLKGQALTKIQIQSWLEQARDSGAWVLENALTADFQMSQRFALIFYDAFSSKTSPHLWEEEFLTRYFEQACTAQGMVSTYACRGSLKRALRASGFEIQMRDGFKSQRQSTLGRRV